MSLIIGLTGGIGSGKTSAARFFYALGAGIIDTDEIARTLTDSHGVAIRDIRQTFGQDFITQDGALDRKKMRDLVFSDNLSRWKLEKILHPLIYKEVVRHQTSILSPYTLIVLPLLFETSNYFNMIQRVLVIDCDERQQVERAIKRDSLNEQEVRAIMSTQISRLERLQRAHDTLINDMDIQNLKEQVKIFHRKYLSLSHKN